MLVCALLVHIAHETAGAARTRLSLRPLFGGQGNFWQTSGESRRENVDAYLERDVIARSEATKQYTLAFAERWIASLRSQ
jgi:hypothetical protein